ncbi:MAG: O-antigen ligase family protein, partial [Thermoleophilaceae bacterium]|nr:O-antigen ligase family protein [Thermoleophilaceae bacterium]
MRQEEALVVWIGLAACVALGLVPRLLPPTAALIPVGGLAGLAAWTLLSLTWAESDERVALELARVLHYLGLLVLALALLSTSTWRWAAGGVFAGAVVVCGLATASRLYPGSFPDSEVERLFDIKRLSYPLNYWNALGAWAAMTIAAGLAISAHARVLLVRMAALAVLPLSAAVIYMTFSRAGIAGAALAVGAAIALARNRWLVAVHAAAAGLGAFVVVETLRRHDAVAEGTGTAGSGRVLLALALAAGIGVAAAGFTSLAKGDKRWRLPAPWGRIALAAAAVVVLVVGTAAARDTVNEAWDDFTDQPVATTQNDPEDRLSNLKGTRYEIWKSAIRAAEDNPIQGVGPGAFEFWWNGDDGGEHIRDAHSLYLEQAAELGIPGGLLVVAFVLGLAGVAVLVRLRLSRSRSIGICAAMAAVSVVYVFHAGVDWMWESTA